MKYNGVILKKFAVLVDILRHHLDDLVAFRKEVTGAP